MNKATAEVNHVWIDGWGFVFAEMAQRRQRLEM
jgi:hypothetical protein